MAESLDNMRVVLRRNRYRLLQKANVIGVGLGYKVSQGRRTPELSMVCSVARKLPQAELTRRDSVPSTLDGVPTDVVETGRIRTFQSPTDRIRPAPGGVSIGHSDITAGTFGCVVRKGGKRFILSNNHVLANSNVARKGDVILQPGAADGGRIPGDQIAVLSEFVPIKFHDAPSSCGFAQGVAMVANFFAELVGCEARLRAVAAQAESNLVDAAIARPLQDGDVLDRIMEVGTIRDLGTASLGMAVQKSGRTTGFTRGEILQVDVTVNVHYGGGQVATFTDQVMAGAMSQGGDSGSAVLDENNNLIGLLFAGSDNSTITNRIENVFAAFDLTL